MVIGPLKDKVFGVLVSAATFHHDSILLLRRSLDQKFMPGEWSVPAGKIQPREESLEQAVLRELWEEAGIRGRVLRNLGMTWFESVYYQQPLQHIQFNFVVAADRPDVELRDGSNMDHMWLPIDRIDDPPVKIDEFTMGLVNSAVDFYEKNHGSSDGTDRQTTR
ncbi:NUDIX domain-containing protein [Actinomadura sp. NPDC047616]|uniref:NUDIX hydrolase n=1 Tax=Actinomadura sp. NPDC047616 TaxID=3155914 RepID=UPI0033E1616B